MAFCAYCGNQMPEGAAVCPACGKSTTTPAAAVAQPATTSATSGLADNIAGMLAYVTIIPAIIFLVVEPYNRNRFIRFHSFQCIFLCIALIVIRIALGFMTIIPGMFWVIWPVEMVIGFGAFILWLLLLLKAYQGQMWKLPVVGDIAEQQANR
ncbi:MAG: hypothetical protein JO187_03185 [Acidobacteria bacterium]|nr:hypothetical protein [Acidobacteriaceae bacterium]MBV9608539.1 hypothetical protein [Acidobacteriota bacterium]